MKDPIAYSLGVSQGTADALNRRSSPTPPEYEDNPDYAAGYAQGEATASGPVSEPAPTDPKAVHDAGYTHGLADRANQSSSPVPLEHEDSKDYAEGYAEADPEAYYAGEQAGRADTVQKRSSMTPPEYEGNAAYAKGYADGLAAPPYLNDLEAQEKAEEDGRRVSVPILPRLDLNPPGPPIIYDDEHPRPQGMSPYSPGDYPPPGPESEDGEMPHGEYGPERPGQQWDENTHSWKWSWEMREEQLRSGEGEGEAVAD